MNLRSSQEFKHEKEDYTVSSRNGPALNVLDFGAKGDNKTDNTAAFQTALNKAQSTGGGTVYAPPGLYRFAGSLNIADGVTLQGSFNVIPSHDVRDGAPITDGTVLMPTAGRGSGTGTPFITINSNAFATGFVVFYPEQLPKGLPVPYPYAISMTGNNAAIADVELLNAFNGITAVSAHRHYIARIQGQPLNVGIFVDETYDIGRIEDVHFNPWFSCDPDLLFWQTTYGRAFVFGRSDWEYVFNTFAFGYAIGYHFIETPTGSMNGNFLGLGSDLSVNASVQVDASQAPGILITNGEFTAFHDKGFTPKAVSDPAQVVVSASNTGPVQFVNTAFWGPTNSVARLYGTGTVSFQSCTFVNWDQVHHDGTAAIRSFDGNLIVQGSNFQQDSPAIELGPATKKASIIGNVFKGTPKIISRTTNPVSQLGNV